MTHIFAASSLSVTGNPEHMPSHHELNLPDGKTIAELLDETKNQNQGKDDSKQSNRETLS
jgi:hypothetical protein